MNGKQLRAKRKLLGLTAEELGKRVGVTKQTISNIETERYSSKVVEKLMAYELAKEFIEWDMKSLTVNIEVNLKEES